MKKKIFIGIIIVVLLIIAIFGIWILKDSKEEEKLDKEMNEINDLFNEKEIPIDKIKSKLNNNVTTGDYLVVEKALKEYLNDIITCYSKFDSLIDADKIGNILSIDNYKKDGKDFKETKAYIDSSKKDLNDIKNEFSSLLEQDTINSYIKDKDVDSYYKDLYQKYVKLEDDETKVVKEEIDSSIDDLIELLDNSLEAVNLLSNNKEAWYIEDNTIYITDDKVLEKYNSILNKIQ